jgi:hypothetical protein
LNPPTPLGTPLIPNQRTKLWADVLYCIERGSETLLRQTATHQSSWAGSRPERGQIISLIPKDNGKGKVHPITGHEGPEVE